MQKQSAVECYSAQRRKTSPFPPSSSGLRQLPPVGDHFSYFFCVLLDLSWNYKQKHLHILILPGSYTKGGTLHTLFMVSHLGESPLLICTSRKTERRGEEEMPGEEKESSKRREGGRTERARADGSIMYLLHSSARRDNTFYGGITLFFFSWLFWIF